MTKFRILKNFEKQEGQISTAINNIKQALLNGEFYEEKLKKEAQRCTLNPEELIQRSLEVIKEENGGALPDDLQKKYKNLEAA